MYKRLIVILLTLPLVSMAQDDSAGEEIILKDKTQNASEIDFIEEGVDPSGTANKAKKKVEIKDEEVLKGLKEEVEKAKPKEEAFDKAEVLPKKRIINDPSGVDEDVSGLDQDELKLKEDELENIEVEKSKKQQSNSVSDQEAEEFDEFEATEDRGTPQEDSPKSAEEETFQASPADEIEPDFSEDTTPSKASSRKWGRVRGGPATLPAETNGAQEPPRSDGVEVDRAAYTEGTVYKKCNCRYDALVPYAQRRGGWTNTFGLGYSTYNPLNYEPDAAVASFDEAFGTAETPLVDVNFGFKKNFSLGAIALDLSAGFYSNQGASETNLQLTIGSLAASYYLDNIWNEPYFVPYATIGASYLMYTEKTAASQLDGGTSTIYFGGGFLVQLDWMDEQANIDSYEEFGLENTFLYFEGRTYPDMKIGGDETSPDFSSPDIALLGGLKFEF